MSSYNDVMRFLNDVDANLSGVDKKMKGGSTEPYSTYETFLNNIFGYTKYVFENDEKNKKDLENSINLLNQCRKHKEEICNADDEIDNETNMTMITNNDIEENIEEKKYTGVLLLKGDELE